MLFQEESIEVNEKTEADRMRLAQAIKNADGRLRKDLMKVYEARYSRPVVLSEVK